MGTRRFIPRNHRAGYKYLLRASLPLLCDVLLLFTSNPLLLLLFLSPLLSPLLFGLFTSCIAETSQKEDGKKVGDLGKKGGDPGRAEALWPAGSPAPGTVPSQRHMMGPHIPPARGTAAPRAGSSSTPGIALALGWTDAKSRRGVEVQQSLSHLLPGASQGLSAPLPSRLWPDAFLHWDEPVPLSCSPVRRAASSQQGQLPHAIPASVAGHEAAGPRRTDVVGNQKYPPTPPQRGRG